MQPEYEDPPRLPEDLEYGEPPSKTFPECRFTQGMVGNPISIYTGNNYEKVTDLAFPSPFRGRFALVRSYNSRSGDMGYSGAGWSHSFSASLDPGSVNPGGRNIESDDVEFLPPSNVKITDETGRSVYFVFTEEGEYKGDFKEKSSLRAEGEGYVWHRLDGRRYLFTLSGQLFRMEDASGNAVTLLHDENGRLITATDLSGNRTLTFHYDDRGLLEHVSGPETEAVPDGIWVAYEYDDMKNLTAVIYADGSGYDYVYEDPYDPNNLTEKHDRMGNLISTWSYDDQDRAVTCTTGNGRDVIIQYDRSHKVIVTDAYGVDRTYDIWNVDGRRRITDIDTPEDCIVCGNDPVRLEYDHELNLIEVEYTNGRIDQYLDHDDRGNARTVIHALGTDEERTVRYAFHPMMNVLLSRSEAGMLTEGERSVT